ncbi:MAG TPA: GGDEF domain-containing protein [Acidimicrobiales bacterium]|nr:GGDEF domain-containing protein [Acidimicrobiales bacterium]
MIAILSRFQELVYSPSTAALFFPVAAFIAVVSVMPGAHWSRSSLVVLYFAAGGAVFAVALRLSLGRHAPDWNVYLEMVMSIIFISLLAAVGPRGHVNFAVMYFWLILFVALYFRPRIALSYIALAGLSYVVVLGVGPSVTKPVIAWFSIFGTGMVLAVVVLGLVQTLHQMGRQDVLTGLPNRRSWEDRVEEEIERARRDGTPLSLAVIDIDHFKAVNDRDGHHVGDRLLREFATGWSETTRTGGDFLARIGGDEFGYLAPGSDEMRVQRAVVRLSEVTPNGVTSSIGTATWDGVESAAEFFRRADEAMYRAKRRSRAA